MTVLSLVLEALGRLAAFALGAWMAYTEATGTYEFYLAEQGSFNYIVKAAVGVTLASVLLPHFMIRAMKRRQWGLTLAMVFGFLMSVAVILTAGIHRTGSVADTAKADIREAKRKLDAAKANVTDAEAALADDKKLKTAECKTGVGDECKKLAGAGRQTLATTLQLRKQYADTKEPAEDRTAERLSALTGGYLSKERIETFQPTLVPIAVSFLAGLLTTVALEADLPSRKDPKPERKGWWRRRRESPQPAPSQRPAREEPETIELTPVMTVVEPRVPERPRPRLAAATRKPVAAVLDFLHEAVEIVDDSTRIEMADCYIGYTAWCKAKSLRALEPGEFCNELTDLCAQFGIPIQEEMGCVYLINVQLGSHVAAKEEVA